jgi:hypothetical protein
MNWDWCKSILKFFSPVFVMHSISLHCILPQQHYQQYGQRMLPGLGNIVHNYQRLPPQEHSLVQRQRRHVLNLNEIYIPMRLTDRMLVEVALLLIGLTHIQGCGSAFISSGSSILGWIPIRIQGFNDQKMDKNYSWKNIKFFLIKNYNLPIPRPP